MTDTVIDKKIETAKKRSDFLYKESERFNAEDKINELLDRMNELSKIMQELHGLIIELVFEIGRDMVDFKESKIAHETLSKFTTTNSKILRIIRKSDLYPGVKTIFYNLRLENNYLKELIEDSQMSIELEDDKELKKIVKDSIKASKGI